jgi:multidrug efflux pump subunit AcrA (membrane-fusion protein)
MRKLLLITFALCCLAAAVAGLYWSAASARVRVTLAEVQLAELERGVDTNGRVEAERVFEIRAPFAGVCRQLHAGAGDRLRAGQPILTLDDAPLRADLAAALAEVQAAESELSTVRRGAPPEEVNQAEADVARHRLELANARRTLETNEWLARKDAISRWELDQSRHESERLQQLLDAATTRLDGIRNRFGDTDRSRAAARLDAAKSRVALLQSNFAKSSVRAPADGTLYDFEVKDGAFVANGDLLGRLADLERIRLRAFVDEPELAQVSLDSVVTVHWDGLANHTWSGTVIRLPAQVVPRGTRSVGEVLCSVQDSTGALVPNLNVDVHIRKPGGRPAPALPRETVLQDAQGQYAWVLRSGSAAKARVRTGRSTARLIEITDGLKPGDRVIVPGDAPIDEGVKVRVAE